jgi:hypothetical protein
MTPSEQSYCEIPLSRGLTTRISQRLYDEYSKLTWYALYNVSMDKFYAARHVNTPNGNRIEYMHRRILGLGYGDRREGDHRDQDTLNNTDDNLRIANRGEQQRNQKARKNNKSGYKGVHFNKRTGKWIAQIRINWKRIHLGSFDTPELAYDAYCKAAMELHGEFANVGHCSPPTHNEAPLRPLC